LIAGCDPRQCSRARELNGFNAGLPSLVMLMAIMLRALLLRGRDEAR